ncbi:hypothetical protein FRAHR75_2710003 [Frankia sp. Hr75.2]|nr:hypothetical protein FRAHR75_2710003 [Frankia sp. Hr75.2]
MGNVCRERRLYGLGTGAPGRPRATGKATGPPDASVPVSQRVRLRLGAASSHHRPCTNSGSAVTLCHSLWGAEGRRCHDAACGTREHDHEGPRGHTPDQS